MGNGSNQLLPPDMYGTTHSRDHSPSSMRTNQESLDHFSFPSSSSEQSLTNVKGVFLTPQLPRKAKNHGHRSLSQSFSSAQGEERYSGGCVLSCKFQGRWVKRRWICFLVLSLMANQISPVRHLTCWCKGQVGTSPDQRLSHGSPLSLLHPLLYTPPRAAAWVEGECLQPSHPL